MKTLGIILLVTGTIAGITGVVMKPEEKKEMYSVSFSIDIPPMTVNYTTTEGDGSVEGWVHCGICQQGIIRKEDGKCSYCGKSQHDKQQQE